MKPPLTSVLLDCTPAQNDTGGKQADDELAQFMSGFKLVMDEGYGALRGRVAAARAQPSACKAVVVEAEAASGATDAGRSEFEAIMAERKAFLTNLGVAKSEALFEPSDGGGAPGTVRGVEMAESDTAHACRGDLGGGGLKELVNSACDQLGALKASLAVTEVLEVDLRETLQLQSELEAGTLKIAQSKEEAGRILEVLAGGRCTRSLHAGFDALRKLGAATDVARLKERCDKPDGDLEAALRVIARGVALEAGWTPEDWRIEKAARRAAAATSYRPMTLKRADFKLGQLKIERKRGEPAAATMIMAVKYAEWQLGQLKIERAAAARPAVATTTGRSMARKALVGRKHAGSLRSAVPIGTMLKVCTGGISDTAVNKLWAGRWKDVCVR